VLDEVSNFRENVVINIRQAPYNGQFTFIRKTKNRSCWVELITREILDVGEESLLHVSKPVFYGMAEWACAILNAKRVVGKTGAVTEVSPEPILWSVLWCATDGDHEVAKVKAVSAKQARYFGWRQWTVGNFPSITFDLMYAVPADKTRYVRTVSSTKQAAPAKAPAKTTDNPVPPGTGNTQLSLLFGT
jgi:hypothetical protein